MKKIVVLAGGGHAHLYSLSNIAAFIKEGMDVTVINPQEELYYSGMGPGMLSGYYSPDMLRFNIKKMAESGNAGFVMGEVVKILPRERKLILDREREVKYDVVSFNTGGFIDFDAGKYENVYKVKPMSNLIKAKEDMSKSIKNRIKVLVAGGGAAGVEVAANIHKFLGNIDKVAEIQIVSSGRFLDKFPERVRKIAIKFLNKKMVGILENSPIVKTAENRAVLKSGDHIGFDFAFISTGISPSNIYADAGLSGKDDRGLRVNRYLQSVKYPEIFGGGDCIFFEPLPLPRSGVYAVKENEVLFSNIFNFAAGRPEKLKPFLPHKKYLQIFNLGNGEGIFYKGRIAFRSALAFAIKDHLDTSFMKKYQI